VNNNINVGGGGSTTTGTSAGQQGQQQVTFDSTLARFDGPTGIARDKDGNLYVADSNNFTIRKIAVNGAVTTLAGRAGQKGDMDGAGNAARFTSPGALTLDNLGNLYVLDGRNLRKLVLATGTVTTVVRTPEVSNASSNDFLLPDGLVADSKGNVFVSDYLLGAVWKVDTRGQVTRFATVSAGIADPTGSGPSAIAIDASDNLFVTDLPFSPNAGGTSSIRKIDVNGVVSTVVEQSVGLVNAHGLAIDANGDFFVNENSLIVRVNASSGIVSYTLPDSPAGGKVSASGIAVNSTGDKLYFTDAAKNTVDLLQTNGNIQIVAGKAGEAGSADVGP
jgi:sugar lactone lactonase YvrE